MEKTESVEQMQEKALPKLIEFIQGYIDFMAQNKANQQRQFFNTNHPARKVMYAWNKWLSWNRKDFAGFFNNLDSSHQDCVLAMMKVELEDELDRNLFTTFLRMAWNTNPGRVFKGISKIKGFKNFGDAKNWGILMLHLNETQPELAKSVCFSRYSS